MKSNVFFQSSLSFQLCLLVYRRVMVSQKLNDSCSCKLVLQWPLIRILGTWYSWWGCPRKKRPKTSKKHTYRLPKECLVCGWTTQFETNISQMGSIIPNYMLVWKTKKNEVTTLLWPGLSGFWQWYLKHLVGWIYPPALPALRMTSARPATYFNDYGTKYGSSPVAVGSWM